MRWASGRRAPSPTSRWTAPGRSTRRGSCSRRARSTPRSCTAFGRSSPGDLSEILAVQLDPYYVAPLWPDPTSLAALQAQAMIDRGMASEADFAAVASRSRRSALSNPKAQVAYDRTPEELLAEDYEVAPLRRHALPPLTDGCAAVVLAAGDKAYEWCERPAFITGHRPPDRDALARRPRPDGFAVDQAGGRAGRGRGQEGRRGRAARALRPPGADPGRGAAGSTTRCRSTRPAARWRPTR